MGPNKTHKIRGAQHAYYNEIMTRTIEFITPKTVTFNPDPQIKKWTTNKDPLSEGRTETTRKWVTIITITKDPTKN